MTLIKRTHIYLISVLALILIASCNNNKQTDFTKLTCNEFYAGTMPDGNTLFLNFSSTTKKKIEGTCFFDKNKAVVKQGTFSIKNSSTLLINISGEKTKYKGNFDALTDSLIFEIKKPEKAQIIFVRQKHSICTASPNRYKDEIFTDIKRSEVIYGKAPGFYQSKHVKDMNSESYPKIIFSVTKSIAKNIFSKDLNLRMDIYEAKHDSLKHRPLLLLIHGGAFIVGDKRDNFQIRLAKYFTKRGYVVASINYRMGYIFLPGAYGNLERCIYKAVQDSRAAIRYLLHHKNEYRIDPDNIFIAGNSAGGFISMKTAFMTNDEAFKSTKANIFMLYDDLGCLDCSTNKHKEKFKIKGVVNMWGALTDINIIDKNEQYPTLLIHGDSDRIVPYNFDFPFKNIDEEYSSFFVEKLYGSESVYIQMGKYKIPSKLVTIAGGTHEPQTDKNNRYTKTMKLIQNEMNVFLRELIAKDSSKINGDFKLKANDKTPLYSVETDKQSVVYWTIEGGTYTSMNKDQSSIRVLWFADEKSYSIQACILNKNGRVSKGNKIQIEITP